MKYSKFGKTGLEVSAIALGTWGIGGAGWGNTDYKASEEAVMEMIKQGVNLIDMAPAYNAGEAERFIGSLLKEYRKKLIYVTKTGTQYVDGKYVRDNSPEAIRKQCEESLENLQTDYVDVYLVHWPDENVPIKDTFTELAHLKREGLIRHIGVSNFSLDQVREAENYAEIEVTQDQYSMVYRKEEKKLLELAHKGFGTMTYGSLGGGILSGKYRVKPEFESGDMRKEFYNFFEEPQFSAIKGLLKSMDEISENRDGVLLSQIALNWSVQKEEIDTAIVGVRSKIHAKENCDGMLWSLTEEEMKRLNLEIEKLVI